jgi:hypothetical protein
MDVDSNTNIETAFRAATLKLLFPCNPLKCRMATQTPQSIAGNSRCTYDNSSRNNNKRKPNQISQDAYNEIVDALSKDMPIIMHGSGDVKEVNPDTQMLLSRLTADYISNLVEAAVDAHAILNGGQRPPLPPPPPPAKKKRKEPPLPAPYIWPADVLAGVSTTGSSKSSTAASKKKSANSNKNNSTDINSVSGTNMDPNLRGRRQRDVDYWDEPLPEPKIKNKPPPSPSEEERRRQKEGLPQEKVIDGVKISDWVGVAGIDFFADSRARRAHVAMPAAIGTQSFLFPVCHDAALYGKILDIQSARRSLEPLLANATIRDVVRNESGSLRKRRRETNKRKPKSNSGGDGGGTEAGAASGEDDDEVEDDEREATDSEDDEMGAAWPGLEELLPVHTTKDFLRSMM